MWGAILIALICKTRHYHVSATNFTHRSCEAISRRWRRKKRGRGRRRGFLLFHCKFTVLYLHFVGGFYGLLKGDKEMTNRKGELRISCRFWTWCMSLLWITTGFMCIRSLRRWCNKIPIRNCWFNKILLDFVVSFAVYEDEFLSSLFTSQTKGNPSVYQWETTHSLVENGSETIKFSIRIFKDAIYWNWRKIKGLLCFRFQFLVLFLRRITA